MQWRGARSPRINLPRRFVRDCRVARRRSLVIDRKRLCELASVFHGPHRRASRPSRRDPGIDAGAGRPACRHALRWSANLLRHAAQFVVSRNVCSVPDRAGRMASERASASTVQQSAGAFGWAEDMRAGGGISHHRSTYRRPDPAAACLSVHLELFRFQPWPNFRSAAWTCFVRAATSRRRQPAGAAEPRRFPESTFARLPRSRSEVSHTKPLCRYPRRRRKIRRRVVERVADPLQTDPPAADRC